MAYTRQDLPTAPQPFYPELDEAGYLIVNQQPPKRNNFEFPINFPVGKVLAVSVIKVIVGSIFLISGVINLFEVPHFASFIGIAIWSGLTILANGVIGCLIWKRKSKFLIGAFYGLSIASLVLTVTMAVVYSLALEYFIDTDFRYINCNTHSYPLCNYQYLRKPGRVRLSTGLSGFVLFLIVVELGCSIAAIVFSCKAYSKCCTTCSIDDCCACVGCCECGTDPKDQHVNEVPYHDQKLQLQQQPFFGFGNNLCSSLLNMIGFGVNSGSPMMNLTINLTEGSCLPDSVTLGPGEPVQTETFMVDQNSGTLPHGRSPEAGNGD